MIMIFEALKIALFLNTSNLFKFLTQTKITFYWNSNLEIEENVIFFAKTTFFH